jgi:hypothetical protein
MGIIMVNLDLVERAERVHTVLKYLLERRCSKRLFEKVLNMCPDPECDDCGRLVCINGEPLHFHHDGCPGCDGTRTMFDERQERLADMKWESDTADWHDYDEPMTREDHRGQ